MNEIVKVFRNFLGRDLVFLISGGAVVGTFLYLFDPIPLPQDSWVLFALLGGVGYFLAYAMQEVCCLIGVITTAPVKKPRCFVRWMYNRYHRSEYRKWSDIAEDANLDELQQRIKQSVDNLSSELERLITLQQVGTAGGPGMFLSGVLFSVKWWLCFDPFYGLVAIAGCLLGLSLICLAWLKAAQHAQFLFTHRNH